MKDRRDKGLFWDRAWKLVEGCAKVSPGCDNCWSETETAMRYHHPNRAIHDRAYEVMTTASPNRPVQRFNGHVMCRHDNLDLPLRTRKPTVFAAWNDLYHKDVPADFRDRAYSVMALCPQHTFLVLTKRAERMAKYWTTDRNLWCNRQGAVQHYMDVRYARTCPPEDFGKKNTRTIIGRDIDWPLPNVWHGVTVENQAMADERIPCLRRVPGKRFLSVEPMLSAIDMHLDCEKCGNLTDAECPGSDRACHMVPPIHQVLLGGESGKNARPMHPDWVRGVRDQCEAASVPFFLKQMVINGKMIKMPELDGRLHNHLSWG
jgi:protein gp37